MLTVSRQLLAETLERRSLAVSLEPDVADGAGGRRYEIAPNSRAQFQFLTDVTTYCLLGLGGIGSGKTWMLGRYVMLKMRRERGRRTIGGIFANTYDQLEKVTLPEIWAVFAELGMEDGKDYVYNRRPPWPGFKTRFKKHNRVLSVRDWGQAMAFSLDDPDAARGPTLGWAAGDELRDWEYMAFKIVMGRLRCPRCSHVEFRGVTSPAGFNWIYDFFVTEAEKQGDRRKIINLKTSDNARNLAQDYEADLRRVYDERFAQQELDGKFVSQISGMVFYGFDRTINRRRIAPLLGAKLLISFDFNRTPFTVLIGQRIPIPNADGLDAVHVLDEVRMENAGTADVCKEVFRRVKGIDRGVEVHVFGDASGGYVASTNSNVSDYEIISAAFRAAYGDRFHRRWPDANPSIAETVNVVNGMLRPASGAPRLLIHPRCEHLIKDLEQVRYIKGSKEIDKSDKERTHASDCLRYMLNTEFPLPGRRAGLVMI